MTTKQDQAVTLATLTYSGSPDEQQKIKIGAGHELQPAKQKIMVNTRVELATLALLAPRSNQLS
jgi:hypothetical protein